MKATSTTIEYRPSRKSGAWAPVPTTLVGVRCRWFRLPLIFRRPLRGDAGILLGSAFLAGLLHAALFFVGAGAPEPETAVRLAEETPAEPIEIALTPPDLPAGLDEGVGDSTGFVEAPQVPSLPDSRVPVVVDSSRMVIDVASVSAVGGFADPSGFVRQLSRSGGGRALQTVFNLAELDRPPVVEAQPMPRYPSALEHSRVTGEVVVGFIVDAKGQVREARILEPSRNEFEEAALQAVVRWKFKPGRKGGRAVAVRMEAPIAFALPTSGQHP